MHLRLLTAVEDLLEHTQVHTPDLDGISKSAEVAGTLIAQLSELSWEPREVETAGCGSPIRE